MGSQTHGIDPHTLDFVVDEIKKVYDLGVEVALVVGGGNLFRGVSAQAALFPRHTADTMGMLATVMNALALSAHLNSRGIPSHVMAAFPVGDRVDPFNADRARARLAKKEILVFGGGTANPYFTTDTAAVLRALEIGADLLVKATKVDGVYDADPVTIPQAKRYTEITYKQVMDQNLRVMDQTAVALACDNALPMRVLNLNKKDAMLKAMQGAPSGTRIRV